MVVDFVTAVSIDCMENFSLFPTSVHEMFYIKHLTAYVSNTHDFESWKAKIYIYNGVEGWESPYAVSLFSPILSENLQNCETSASIF